MNMGWLTESTLRREKPKQIKIDDRGLNGLKAILMGGKPEQTKAIAPKGIKRNRGVEQRIERDNMQQSAPQAKDTYRALERKQVIYDSEAKKQRNHSQLLVDFVSKAIELEDEDYERLKEEFYKGKLNEVEGQRARVHEGQNETEEKDLRERLAWEKDILNQLKGVPLQAKLNVIQSFDHKLSQEEKIALEEVISEKIEENKRRAEILKRREEMEEDRVCRLKKLKIIPD